MKKNPSRLLFAFIMLFVFSNHAWSTHLVSAGITYAPVLGSPNEYVIKLIIYKDCDPSSAPLGNSLQIFWESPSGCGSNGQTTIGLVQGTGVGNRILTSSYPACVASVCDTPAGPAYGVDLYVYSGNIVLPAGCPDWEISYSDCCRNSEITTGPADESIYVMTSMNTWNFPADRSPVFNHPAVATTCIGRPYIFDLSATDPDGDSLVYRIDDCWQAPGSPNNYIPPYSGAYPIVSNPLPALNSQTGLLTLHPTNVQIGVFSVIIDAYNRQTGLYKGSSRRDAQINVESVCNDPHRLDSIQVHLNNLSVACYDSVLQVKLSWKMRCNTLAPDGSDFRLLLPSNIPLLIRRATALNCNVNGLTDSLSIDLRGMLTTNGIYKLVSKEGYDGNTILDSCGLAIPEYDTCYFTFNNCFVGIEEYGNDPYSLEIYPNPSDEFIFVKTKLQGTKRVSIYNPAGQCVKQLSATDPDFKINVATLPNGMYSLKILNDKILRCAFFVVNH